MMYNFCFHNLLSIKDYYKNPCSNITTYSGLDEIYVVITTYSELDEMYTVITTYSRLDEMYIVITTYPGLDEMYIVLSMNALFYE